MHVTEISLPVHRLVDGRSLPPQRFFNVPCIAYGSDGKLFADFVEQSHPPRSRAKDCQDEYQQVACAFDKLIGIFAVQRFSYDRRGPVARRRRFDRPHPWNQYGTRLVLARHDQHIAWHRDSVTDVGTTLDRVRGAERNRS